MKVSLLLLPEDIEVRQTHLQAMVIMETGGVAPRTMLHLLGGKELVMGQVLLVLINLEKN
jgi:hypothetical protein